MVAVAVEAVEHFVVVVVVEVVVVVVVECFVVVAEVVEIAGAG